MRPLSSHSGSFPVDLIAAARNMLQSKLEAGAASAGEFVGTALESRQLLQLDRALQQYAILSAIPGVNDREVVSSDKILSEHLMGSGMSDASAWVGLNKNLAGSSRGDIGEGTDGFEVGIQFNRLLTRIGAGNSALVPQLPQTPLSTFNNSPSSPSSIGLLLSSISPCQTPLCDNVNISEGSSFVFDEIQTPPSLSGQSSARKSERSGGEEESPSTDSRRGQAQGDMEEDSSPHLSLEMHFAPPFVSKSHTGRHSELSAGSIPERRIDLDPHGEGSLHHSSSTATFSIPSSLLAENSARYTGVKALLGAIRRGVKEGGASTAGSALFGGGVLGHCSSSANKGSGGGGGKGGSIVSSSHVAEECQRAAAESAALLAKLGLSEVDAILESFETLRYPSPKDILLRRGGELASSITSELGGESLEAVSQALESAGSDSRLRPVASAALVAAGPGSDDVKELTNGGQRASIEAEVEREEDALELSFSLSLNSTFFVASDGEGSEGTASSSSPFPSPESLLMGGSGGPSLASSCESPFSVSSEASSFCDYDEDQSGFAMSSVSTPDTSSLFFGGRERMLPYESSADNLPLIDADGRSRDVSAIPASTNSSLQSSFVTSTFGASACLGQTLQREAHPPTFPSTMDSKGPLQKKSAADGISRRLFAEDRGGTGTGKPLALGGDGGLALQAQSVKNPSLQTRIPLPRQVAMLSSPRPQRSGYHFNISGAERSIEYTASPPPSSSLNAASMDDSSLPKSKPASAPASTNLSSLSMPAALSRSIASPPHASPTVGAHAKFPPYIPPSPERASLAQKAIESSDRQRAKVEARMHPKAKGGVLSNTAAGGKKRGGGSVTAPLMPPSESRSLQASSSTSVLSPSGFSSFIPSTKGSPAASKLKVGISSSGIRVGEGERGPIKVDAGAAGPPHQISGIGSPKKSSAATTDTANAPSALRSPLSQVRTGGRVNLQQLHPGDVDGHEKSLSLGIPTSPQNPSSFRKQATSITGSPLASSPSSPPIRGIATDSARRRRVVDLSPLLSPRK